MNETIARRIAEQTIASLKNGYGAQWQKYLELVIKLLEEQR